MNLLIDPIILTLPENTYGKEQCLQFVTSLSDWSSIVISQMDRRFVVTKSCAVALLNDLDRYPTPDNVRRLWEVADIYEVDWRTAYRACKRILEAPYFEDEVSVPMEISYEDIQVRPDLIERLSASIAFAFREALAKVAYAKEISQDPFALSLGLITHPIENGDDAEINGVVNESDLATELPLLETPADLRRIVGLYELWKDTDEAIAWAVDYLKRKRCLPDSAEMAPYSVGADFNASIVDNHYNTRYDRLAQIFVKTAQLLTGQIPHKKAKRNHPLRKDGKPMIRWDESSGERWEAWRFWITTGSHAMRLHYWWQNGNYFLSKVGPHEDYSIGSAPSIGDFD